MFVGDDTLTSTDRTYDPALGYARQVFDSAGVEYRRLDRGERFPSGAFRGCLLLGRPEAEVAQKCANGAIGFDIRDGKAYGVDHCNGPAVVVF